MQGSLFYIPEKIAPPCISPNVPETLKHHLHVVRTQRKLRWLGWLPPLKTYWNTQLERLKRIMDAEAAFISEIEQGSDRRALEPPIRNQWKVHVVTFSSKNTNISSATAVRVFSKTLRAYDNALCAYHCAEPKQTKHLQAIFETRWAYEASARTAQYVAPRIEALASTHFTTHDTVSRVPENQAAWQNFQATARVKQEAKHGFKMGFWMGVGLVAVVAVAVAVIVFSGGTAAIPALAGAVAAHSVATAGLVAVAACAAPPIAIGGLFGSLGAGVQRLVEWGSRRSAIQKAASQPTVVGNPIYGLQQPASASVDVGLALNADSPAASPGRAGASTSSLSDGFDESVVPLAAAAGPGGLYTVVRPMTPPPVFAPEGESPQA